MRMIYGLALLAVAACGDNKHLPGTIDANDGTQDGGKQDGGNMDAPGDGPLPSNASRVWAIGNYVVDTKRQAGAFIDGVTLPFGNGTQTPITVPPGSATLPSSAGYTAQVFDASASGTKTAFVADLTVAGRFDLYAANATGGSPTLLVTGAVNIEIPAIAISPDGTKVAYTMDSTLIDGGFDLYWITTTGTGTAVKVSPSRPLIGVTNPGALDVGVGLFWSRDSRYLGFIGDLTEDTYNQGYVADTNTTNAAVELVSRADIPASGNSQGVFVIAFDAAAKVYFTGRLSMTSTDIQLYRSNPDGTSRTNLTSLVPLRSDNSTPDIGAMGMSADGTKLAFAADTPTAAHYDIFVHTIGTSTATDLSNFTNDWSPNGFFPLAFSPDGMKVAALGRYNTNSRQNAFVAGGGANGRRVIDVATSCSGCATPDVTQLAWTMDSMKLYLRGDITTNNVSKLYRVDAATTDGSPTLAVDSPATADVLNVIIRPVAN